MEYFRTTAILIIFLTAANTQAQESVSASGGDATGTGGFSSYTIGQVMYSTYSGTNGSVAQGVQQPFSITVTTIKKATDIGLECIAYPNPTKSFLTLKVDNYNNEKLTFQVKDMMGKLLIIDEIDQKNKSINLQDFAEGTYFLSVLDNNSTIQVFKILKIK